MSVRRKQLATITGLVLLPSLLYGASSVLTGDVRDPEGQLMAGAAVELVCAEVPTRRAVTDPMGAFSFEVNPGESCAISAQAAGLSSASRKFIAQAANERVELRLDGLTARKEEITVTANVTDVSITSPDPGQRVVVRQELLDANPGRPGAPVSIPGVPIETASGGIKAPQYFVAGVAGDHGEPIAQYIAVGTYMLPNNLSANAHGNGYADPNILIPQTISSVEVNGGAFNVLEGNHALNLGATYNLTQNFVQFVNVTADYRDFDLVAGFGRSDTNVNEWILLEGAYGNGLLDRLEHRRQYKFNALRSSQLGQHALTLFTVGYYGSSYIPGLVPLDVPNLHDTVDPRQKDQTHTFLLAANDAWKLSSAQQLSLSGLFRTYNLALYSNFGGGLIRQSEFRTVVGGNGTYIRRFNAILSLLAGVDYARDAPRRDDLDHYESTDPNYYGPFTPVTSNNITIGDTAPYIAADGGLGKNLHYYLGFRRDEIGFSNQDLLHPTISFDRSVGVNNPKATASFLPNAGSWLPSVSLSWGEAFFTNDPRIGIGSAAGSLVERSHSYQLLLEKLLGKTDVRLTMGHVTTEATFAKIEPDTGLQQDEGPGRLRYLTALVRHQFAFGLLQASLSKADAKNPLSGEVTPEAPRTIVDALGTFDRLPWHLQARGEFEYVGTKPLGDSFVSVPVTELRSGVVRSFQDGRLDAGINLLIAHGFTGQTTEVLALPDDSSSFERRVGVRLVSYVGASISYHFRGGSLP